MPVVASAAGTAGRGGLWALALGLSTAFAVAGTGVVWLLLTLGLDPELFRTAAALMLVLVGLVMLVDALGRVLTDGLSLLGFVWLPCVGPTLGAAITLASLGQDMVMASLVMFAFGAGTASMLMVAGLASRRVLTWVRPTLLATTGRAKQILALSLVVLGLLTLSGVDRILEAWSLRWLPDWVVGL